MSILLENKMKLKLGFNKDIDNADYHADREYVSSSVLKTILKDGKEFERIYINGESSPMFNKVALDMGSYIHALILEPHLVAEEFAVSDSIYQRDCDEWKEFEEANKGLICITKAQYNHGKVLLENFYRKEIELRPNEKVLVNNFFVGGNAEETLCVEMDGIKVKVRFDYRKSTTNASSINDIKTTSKKIKTKKDVEKICKSFGYDLSAALYCDAVEQQTGIKHDFYFVFISKEDNQTTIWKASDQMLESGREKYREALRKLKQGRETGVYWNCGIEEIDAI